MPEYVVGIVGYSLSEDGTQQAVYLDRAGRQFIVDRKGHRLYGVWFQPSEAPQEERKEDRPAPAIAEALARRAGGVGGPSAADAYNAARLAAAREQARLLRDLAGNPFRPVRVDPAWLTWNDGLVVRLTRALDDEGAFDRLPI